MRGKISNTSPARVAKYQIRHRHAWQNIKNVAGTDGKISNTSPARVAKHQIRHELAVQFSVPLFIDKETTSMAAPEKLKLEKREKLNFRIKIERRYQMKPADRNTLFALVFLVSLSGQLASLVRFPFKPLMTVITIKKINVGFSNELLWTAGSLTCVCDLYLIVVGGLLLFFVLFCCCVVFVFFFVFFVFFFFLSLYLSLSLSLSLLSLIHI